MDTAKVVLSSNKTPVECTPVEMMRFWLRKCHKASPLQVTVSTLNDVLKYFLEKTEYRLHPYVVSQPYDTRIGEAEHCFSF